MTTNPPGIFDESFEVFASDARHVAWHAAFGQEVAEQLEGVEVCALGIRTQVGRLRVRPAR